MGRPRLASNVLEFRGAFKKDPQRRRVDLPGVGDIGDPPAHLTPAAAAAWREFVAHAPEGVLTGTDRISLEIMATLLVAFRRTRKLPHKRRLGAALRSWLVQYGYTTGGRVRLQIPPSRAECMWFAKFVESRMKRHDDE